MWRRILIVYGNERIRLEIQEMLNETESFVQVAANKQEAITRVLLAPFDLVIVDRTLIEGSDGRVFKERLEELGALVLPAAPETAWEIQEQPSSTSRISHKVVPA